MSQSFQGANILGGDFKTFSGDFHQHISVESGELALVHVCPRHC